MPEPQPVVVTRPRPSWLDAAATLIGALANVLVSAWVLMLIASEFGLQRYGFAHALLFVVAVRAVLPSGAYLSWSQSWSSAVRRRG